MATLNDQFSVACARGTPGLAEAQLLLDQGDDVNFIYWGRSALQRAAVQPDTKMLRWLISVGALVDNRLSVNSCDDDDEDDEDEEDDEVADLPGLKGPAAVDAYFKSKKSQSRPPSEEVLNQFEFDVRAAQLKFHENTGFALDDASVLLENARSPDAEVCKKAIHELATTIRGIGPDL